jgi:hypothetical protein
MDAKLQDMKARGVSRNELLNLFTMGRFEIQAKRRNMPHHMQRESDLLYYELCRLHHYFWQFKWTEQEQYTYYWGIGKSLTQIS